MERDNVYKKAFILEVKRFYPNSELIHKHLDSGSGFLGRLLQDAIPNDPTDKRYKKACDLYGKWLSGEGLYKSVIREEYCPVWFLQNNNQGDKKWKYMELLCKEVGYVGEFCRCKKWELREKCWKTFDKTERGG